MKVEYFNVSAACPVCGGSGWRWIHTQESEKCFNCNGNGTVYAQMIVDKAHTTSYPYQEA